MSQQARFRLHERQELGISRCNQPRQHVNFVAFIAFQN